MKELLEMEGGDILIGYLGVLFSGSHRGTGRGLEPFQQECRV